MATRLNGSLHQRWCIIAVAKVKRLNINTNTLYIRIKTGFLKSSQALVAKALGVPANRVVCRVKRMGGGFGGKESRSTILSTVVAVAAQKYE